MEIFGDVCAPGNKSCTTGPFQNVWKKSGPLSQICQKSVALQNHKIHLKWTGLETSGFPPLGKVRKGKLERWKTPERAARLNLAVFMS